MLTPELSFRTLAVVLAAAFMLQLAMLMFVLPTIQEGSSQLYSIGFADDYDLLAINIANGNGYRFFPDMALTMMREPGYPLVLSAVFFVFGHSLPAARFVNALFALASAIVLAVIAAKLSQQRSVVLGAPLLFLFILGQ